MGTRILDSIQSPDALSLLSVEELEILASEIRQEIIEVTSKNGGHVASSLGAVEIILAAHSQLHSPHDRFLFDVGHQSYAHMLVTGRVDEFDTLRSYKGLSGFPKPQSNPHDVHPSGHASDSLSVAYGLARARDLRGSDEKIVTLIGDASIAGGMAFEALNDIGQAQTPMVIILNDNEMSISRNVGALAKHLGDVRMSSGYRNSRDSMQDFMEHQMSAAGKMMLRLGRNAKDSLKQFVLPESTLFEKLGIICTPPVNGHDIALLQRMIRSALDADAPVLIHAVTKKGAGYEPAERKPSTFHGVGPYSIATGEVLPKADKRPTYTQAFTNALTKEMEHDKRVVAVTAAMVDGTGLRPIVDKFPDHVFDVGIAEGHAMGMASGLALGGLKPVVCLYSTFFQRAVDQTIIDVALANTDVVIAIDRAGLVGDDGPTHHGMFDMALLRMIPGMRVLAPSDERELAAALHTALTLPGPVAFRYPRGAAAGVEQTEEPEFLEEGKARLLKEGSDAYILSFGRMLKTAQEAADLLAGKGISCGVVDMRWIKPLDLDMIAKAAQTKFIITLEDGVVMGGAGQGVEAALQKIDKEATVVTLGLPDAFVEQGKVDLLFADLGLDAQGVCDAYFAHAHPTDLPIM
ncbi:MAG: 1-deoxy-D-xylulose-5-phosphate synthase [Eggerthellaceae bacterium]|nr:1-deoxy-D-xylulose-5-phosphate synthase [Eggerthellaceae bacterium]